MGFPKLYNQYHNNEYQMMQFIRWDSPSQKSQLFGGKANYGIGGSEESIRDTMRINDDGSLRIPNVNREKHQGMYLLHRIDKKLLKRLP